MHPRPPVIGFVSGHAVYARSCVARVLSRARWYRQGREVRLGEPPFRTIRSDKPAADGGEAQSELFGEWQTEPVHVPAAEGGRVPKNAYGRIELWCAAFLPAGTVHIAVPAIERTVRKLRIDYAPAMVGFERASGSWRPRMVGVVICAEHAAAALEAHEREQKLVEERLAAKQSRRAVAVWRQLCKVILCRRLVSTMDVGQRELLEPAV